MRAASFRAFDFCCRWAGGSSTGEAVRRACDVVPASLPWERRCSLAAPGPDALRCGAAPS